MAVLAATMMAGGCATSLRPVFTASEQATAEVPGFPGVRTWADGTREDFQRAGIQPPRAGEKVNILALSGGGSGGAYGAGVLAGWTASGRRPQFDVVSGVSTGALMAPFAFLGPAYDTRLSYLYTSGITGDLVQMKPLPAALLGSSLFEPEPLRRLVERYATDDLLTAVAAEHRKGRRLLVITTNMDAQRPVVWDMGKIAASNQQGALKLFQDVLMASASIPAALPPVLIDVEARGRRFQEMHSDGGTATQVFMIPDGILAATRTEQIAKGAKADLYVIVNSKLVPEFQFVKDGTLSVGSRGLSTMIKSQTRGSILASYAFARQAGIGFHLTSISGPVRYVEADPFDATYMKSLYQLGYDAAVSGAVWQSHQAFQPASRPSVTQHLSVNMEN